MSKTPSLEEVKKHFENAKVVKCLSDGIVYDITEQALTNIFKNEVGYWIRTGKDHVFLRNANKYAKIIKYKKPRQMTYTLEQIAKHGELMQEYAKDQSIKIEFSFDGKEWKGYEAQNTPGFLTYLKYRKKTAPLFINELGEEFTQEDVENNIAAFFYSMNERKIFVFDILKLDKALESTENTTSVSKTEQGALQLAINKLNK